jgi:hypothetical protein
MLGVTVFGIFFTPVFYSVIRWLSAKPKAPPTGTDVHPPRELQAPKIAMPVAVGDAH